MRAGGWCEGAPVGEHVVVEAAHLRRGPDKWDIVPEPERVGDARRTEAMFRTVGADGVWRVGVLILGGRVGGGGRGVEEFPVRGGCGGARRRGGQGQGWRQGSGGWDRRWGDGHDVVEEGDVLPVHVCVPGGEVEGSETVEHLSDDAGSGGTDSGAAVARGSEEPHRASGGRKGGSDVG